MSSDTTRTGRLDHSAAALWASAFVIGAMLTVQASRLGAPEAAYAGNIAEAGQIRLLTGDGGGGEEFLAVLDITRETISIYGVQNQKSIELHQVAKLPELFEQAKGAAGTKR